LAVACSAPLAVGGVHDAFALAAGAAVAALCIVAALRRPARPGLSLAAPVFVAAAAWALVQTIPGLARIAAPDASLSQDVADALAGTGVGAAWALAPTLPDARTAALRACVLAALFALGRRCRPRTVATALAATAVVESLVVYAQAATDADTLLGFYHARQVDLAQVPYWFGTFVNANHQAAFLLLGLGCALSQVVERAVPGTVERTDRPTDRLVLHAAAAVVILPALAATLSRAGIVFGAVLCLGAGALALPSLVRGDRRNKAVRPQRLAAATAALVLAVAAAIPIARPAIADLAAWGEDPSLILEEPKLRLIREGLPMFRLAPLAGIGGGTFADLWPRFASDPRALPATHLESALFGPALAFGALGVLAVVAAAAVPFAALLRRRRNHSVNGRRILALTLMALALAGLADHWWATLGVSAPAAVLAGSLAEGPLLRRGPRARRLYRRFFFAIAALSLAALAADARTRDERFEVREARNRAIAEGGPYARALALRPLDGRLHLVLGRRFAQAGRWEAACRRGAVAVRFAPTLAGGHLLETACRRRAGDAEGAQVALARALRVLPDPPTPDVVRFLVAVAPDPTALATALGSDAPWRGLAHRLRDVSPMHALAALDRAAALHPDDPTPADLAVRLRLSMGDLAGARAAAARLRERFPNRPEAYRSSLAVLRAEGRGEPAVQALLRAALDRDDLAPDTRDELLEHLARSLGKGDDGARREAAGILTDLLARPAPPEVRIRRARLRDRVTPK